MVVPQRPTDSALLSHACPPEYTHTVSQFQHVHRLFELLLVCSSAVDALKYLELKYTVDWPCNIVITSNCISKYTKVVQLMCCLISVVQPLAHSIYFRSSSC